MRAKLRPLTAEFIGTFGLVFIGGGSVVVNEARSGALGLQGIALAHAIVNLDGSGDAVEDGRRATPAWPGAR